MPKKRSPRYDPLSNNWARLVFRTAGVSDQSEQRALKRELARLWHKGYSHKDAAAILMEREQ